MLESQIKKKLKQANAFAATLEQTNKLLSRELGQLRHQVSMAEADNAELKAEIQTLKEMLKTPKRTTKKTQESDEE